MVELSDFERSLVLELRRNPRASYTELASPLGVDKRTVGRTIGRLQSSGLLDFSSIILHENANGWLVAQVEVTCEPGCHDSVARALALRPDTRFVAVTTGSADVVADLVAPGPLALNDILGTEIGLIDGVASIRTQVVIRLLLTAVDWDPTGFRTDRRTLAESGQESPRTPPLDDTDYGIARVLDRDPRAPLATIAKDVDVHESTVQRRLKTMIASGHLTIRADVPPAALGYPIETRFSLAVRPADLASALQRLSNEPTLRALYSVTGPSNVLGYSVHESVAALETLSSGVFAEVPGLITSDISIVLRAYKRSGAIQRNITD